MLKWEAMGGFRWIAENWVTALNTVGVVGGLFFTAFSLHSESKTRRFANLLTITKNHRNIWADFYRNPGLARVLDTTADLSKNSVTREEEIFVNLVSCTPTASFTPRKTNSLSNWKACGETSGGSFHSPFLRQSGNVPNSCRTTLLLLSSKAAGIGSKTAPRN